LRFKSERALTQLPFEHREDVLPVPVGSGLVENVAVGQRVAVLETEPDVVGHRRDEGERLTPPERDQLLRETTVIAVPSRWAEPFGLVGLEAMAAGGVACTGCSGEDYAIAGENALVLESNDPHEFLELFTRLRSQPGRERALRRAEKKRR